MKPKILFLEESKEQSINPRWNFTMHDNRTDNFPWFKNSVHYHSFFEAEIIYRGKTEHILNNEAYTAQRGDVYILRYFDFHTYKNPDNSSASIYNFAFNSAALPSEVTELLINAPGNVFCHFPEDEFELLINDIHQLKQEIKSRSGNPIIRDNIIKTDFEKIMLTVLNKYFKASTGISNASTAPFQQAIAIIQRRFRDPITLDEISGAVGLTPNYLGKLFIKNIGLSFSEYIRKIRLEYAKNLLGFYDYSIDQIAALSGFRTASHFIHCFKIMYNITPKQYMLNGKLNSKKDGSTE